MPSSQAGEPALPYAADMPVYRLAETCIEALPDTDFAACGIKERGDLQRLLRANVGVVAPDVLVIAEEFGEWEESKRRIDLLGGLSAIAKHGNDFA